LAAAADEAGLVDLLDGKTVLEDGYAIQLFKADEEIALPPVIAP